MSVLSLVMIVAAIIVVWKFLSGWQVRQGQRCRSRGSVTEIVCRVLQPRGGFLPLSWMHVQDISVCDGERDVDWGYETADPAVIGTAVDALTRYLLGESIRDAFASCVVGMRHYAEHRNWDSQHINNYIWHALRDIHGTDDKSIRQALFVAAHDGFFAGEWAHGSAYTMAKKLDTVTIENVSIMVERSVKFFHEQGPVVATGFRFDPYGYTETVTGGEGDYLTEDTLWDMKCSRKAPTQANRLQVLMYYVMGKHSGNPMYKSIRHIGLYNPRLNRMWVYDMNAYPAEMLKQIETEVCGFGLEQTEA